MGDRFATEKWVRQLLNSFGLQRQDLPQVMATPSGEMRSPVVLSDAWPTDEVTPGTIWINRRCRGMRVWLGDAGWLMLVPGQYQDAGEPLVLALGMKPARLSAQRRIAAGPMGLTIGMAGASLTYNQEPG